MGLLKTHCTTSRVATRFERERWRPLSRDLAIGMLLVYETTYSARCFTSPVALFCPFLPSISSGAKKMLPMHLITCGADSSVCPEIGSPSTHRLACF
jgi:hypothetical protein